MTTPPENPRPEDQPDASLDYGSGPAPDSSAPDSSAPDSSGEDETLLIAGYKVGGRPAPADEGSEAPAAPPVSSTLPRGEQSFSPPPAGFRGLLAALRVRRAAPTQVMIAVLCGLLGFFAVVQLRLQADDNNLRSARQSDLIRILDDLNDRSERLDSEIRDLEQRKAELQSGSDRSKAALTEAQGRRAVLGILAGTVAAKGPGIALRIEDPQQKVDAAVLLDALQELRDAGAEAVQINDIRVVAGTDFLDSGPGSVRIDGQTVTAPYLFKVIGDPDTLVPALRIPGGVFAVLDERGAIPSVETRKQITVDATRPAADLDYARPSENN
ncbi:DUF881 domain-containing protein [Sporichthya brevicatena]|uniref:DUF881 domain-containing protein n=1 Tax=Sporichthya brevicatena TaxID=171442 RepID=A0ABN1H7B4_9ACTN